VFHKTAPAGGSLTVDRRAFIVATSGSFCLRLAEAQGEITQPIVSEADCPLEVISPAARDGHRGLGVLRKPPGQGPFPAVIYLHGGITSVPLANLRSTAKDGANPSRFLAAGYVVVVPTYRSRDVDPQSPVSLDDSVAMVDFVRKLRYVDTESIVVFGCSGGGDLALQVPTRTRICAAVAEEPASPVTAGLFNSRVPKKGKRYTPEDSFFMLENPTRYYTPEFQNILRARISRIECPILIVQGNVDRREVPINKFNAEVLIPELRATSKNVEVRTYADQGHCFCAGSGVPRPSGRPTPASGPLAALEAFRDIDTFCRKYLRLKPRNIDSLLLTHVAVRTAW
jgi:acetyl esterase/lipase